MKLYHFCFSYEDGEEFFIGADTIDAAIEYLKESISVNTYNPAILRYTPDVYGLEWYIETTNEHIALVSRVYEIQYGLMKGVR